MTRLEVLWGDGAAAEVKCTQKRAVEGEYAGAVGVGDVDGQLLGWGAKDALAGLQGGGGERWCRVCVGAMDGMGVGRNYLRRLLHVEERGQALDDLILVFDVEIQRFCHNFVSDEGVDGGSVAAHVCGRGVAQLVSLFAAGDFLQPLHLR